MNAVCFKTTENEKEIKKSKSPLFLHGAPERCRYFNLN